MRGREARKKKEAASFAPHTNSALGMQMENLMLKSRIRSLQDSLEFSRNERAMLEARLNALQSGTSDADSRIAELTKQCRELRSLVASATRLLAVNSREEAFLALQDIVANVIGSEDFVLLEMNRDGTAMHATAWCGVNESEGARVAVGEGLVGQVALTGVARTNPDIGSGITACIPLRVGEKVTGVLAICSLLPQKLQLAAWDFQVLQLLGDQMGRLLARFGQRRGRTVMKLSSGIEMLGIPVVRPPKPAAVYLHPGQTYATQSPRQITTIVGSCVAVLLWSSRFRIGGATHYLLPEWDREGEPSARYGDIALAGLLKQMLDLGASVSDLRACVYGGASVLESLQKFSGGLGDKNVEVAREWLRKYPQIQLFEDHTGGKHGRKIIFDTFEGTTTLHEIG